MKVKSLSGKQFGRLKVLQRTDNDKWNRARWICQCECGNVITTTSRCLIGGFSTSCGCLRKERVIESLRKNNAFVISANFMIMYTEKNEPFLIDIEDYGKVKHSCWLKNSKGYIVCRVNNKEIKLHRLITNCPEGMLVDHINGNVFDNRKSNLRICNAMQNGMNRKLSIKNTSGYTGVSWNKKSQKWESTIKANRKRLYLGNYENIEDAVKARKEAEKLYFKEFARKENAI